MTKLNFALSAAAGMYLGLANKWELARAYEALTNSNDMYSTDAVAMWVTAVTLGTICAGAWIAKHFKISFKR